MFRKASELRPLLALLLALPAGLAAAHDGPTGGNIIPNGDFSKGNTGFVCDLPYIEPGYNCLWEGRYTVAARFNDPLLHRLVAPDQFEARTKRTGKEKVLFANAGGSDPILMWAATVKCQPHTRYRISCDFISLTGYMTDDNPPHEVATMEWVPDFEISANDHPSAPIQGGCGKYAEGSMTWDSGDATSATVKIVRTKFPHGGGLIGISNIQMAPIGASLKPSGK